MRYYSDIYNLETISMVFIFNFDLFIILNLDWYIIVIDFARKTGDFRSLSVVDLKVLALTYQMEKELNGAAHLR